MRAMWSLALTLTSPPRPLTPWALSRSLSTPSTPSGMSSGMPADESGPRLEAERSYADGYDQVTKAKKDLDAGKTKNAEKNSRRRSIAWSTRRSSIPTTTKRGTWSATARASSATTPRRSALTRRPCRSSPITRPRTSIWARRISSRTIRARRAEQLAMLERLSAADETTALRAAIDAYDKAHPETKQAPAQSPQSTPAAPDTATKSGL